MRIRNNNYFVFLLALVLGVLVLVAFYGRTYVGEYMAVGLWSQAHPRDVSLGRVVTVAR